LNRIAKLEEEVRQLKANQANNNPIPLPSDTYVVTNGTIDRDYDANASSTAELADIIYTLLSDLGMLS
jgi:hypothetical protein